MSAACWIGLSVIEASGLVLALTTEANAERAQQLAEALLERHLVARVSIPPFSRSIAGRGRCRRPMRSN